MGNRERGHHHCVMAQLYTDYRLRYNAGPVFL